MPPQKAFPGQSAKHNKAGENRQKRTETDKTDKGGITDIQSRATQTCETGPASMFYLVGAPAQAGPAGTFGQARLLGLPATAALAGH